MRRADRLFQITHYLRGRRLTTAAQLAEWLNVSERTIYRDIRDLGLSGVPIQGEAGVGYSILDGYEFPPLSLTADELDALVIGMRMVGEWAGPIMHAAAESVLAKIASSLPKEKRDFLRLTGMYVAPARQNKLTGKRLDTLHLAIKERRTLWLDYLDVNDSCTQRQVWPLALYFFGGVWLLAAWCEKRQDFRAFRVDRIQEYKLNDYFPDLAGHRLSDFIKKIKTQYESKSRK